MRAWGPSTGSTACALAGRRCSLWGWQKGVPGGGAFSRCEGRLRSGAPPPPAARPLGGPLGSATHVLWARVCGCGGPTLSPWPACPVGAACRGGGWGLSPGGLPCHLCEGSLVSGAVSPPAARPLGRAAGFPRPVCPGCSRCGRGDPAPAPQRALAGRRCAPWGWRKGVPGGGAVRRFEGRLGSGAPPPPAARPLGGLLGLATHVLRARVWLCAVCVVSVRCVSWCVVPLFSCPSSAPLSGASLRCGACGVPCACRAPFPARVPCSAAGYPLFRSWLRCSLPVPLLALLPGMHFFPASALVCVSVLLFAGFLSRCAL